MYTQKFSTLRKWLLSGKINGHIFVDLVNVFYYGGMKAAIGFGPRKERDLSA